MLALPQGGGSGRSCSSRAARLAPASISNAGFRGGHGRHTRCFLRGFDLKGSAGFLFPGEYGFNLAEYMVMLDKPVGLTLAPEPHTGRILVQRIQKGSPADMSRLIQVGDWLKKCSAIYGEEMWDCEDVQRTRWAISNRTGKVKLVFERGNGATPPLWYFPGKLGLTSSDVSEGQCILRFDEDADGTSVDACSSDRANCMWVAFNRCSDTGVKPPPSLPASKLARLARIDAIRRQLAEAAAAPEVLLSPPMHRLAAGGAAGDRAVAAGGQLRLQVSGPGGANVPLPLSSQNGAVPFRRAGSPGGSSRRRDAGSSSGGAGGSSGGGAAAAGSGATSSKHAKRVLQLLPWMLLTSSRLTASDLTRLASQRALGALLEYEIGFDSDGVVALRRTAVGGGHSAAAPSISNAAVGAERASGSCEVGGSTSSSSHAMAGAAVGQVVMAASESSSGLVAETSTSESSSSATTTAISSSSSSGVALCDTDLLPGTIAIPTPSPGPSELSSSNGTPSSPSEGRGSPFAVPLPGSSNNSGGWPGGSGSSGTVIPIPNWPATSSSNGTGAGAQAPSAASTAPAIAAESAPAADEAPAAAWERARAEGLAAAAAQLQRLAVRRLAGHVKTGDTQLLLHYQEGSEAGVATLLAGWLVWHQGLDANEAASAARAALGATVDKELLQATSDLLVARARTRFSRIVLIWPYGGMSADVSGELVGGWGERVPMRRCMSPSGCRGAARGQFLVELQGLRPGRYHYKFIIDNTWAVDPFAPKDLDGSGNWNNVCEVRPPPKIETPEERHHFAALQARMMAFDAKMGTGSGVRAGRMRRG